ECRAYFTDERRFANLLAEKLGREPAPESLRHRLASRAERRPGVGKTRAWKSRWWRIAAVILLALAVPLGWFLYRLPSERMFWTICEDHGHYLDARSQMVSSEPSHLEAWFRERVDFGVRVPRLDAGELVGGRLCILRERKAALVFYRREGKTV